MVNTLEKGNKLEETFYQYLLDQQNRGDLVFGAYPPKLCKIYKKKKYYCKEREADVEFDVIIELYLEGRSSIHLIVAFECKNHSGRIPEIYVNDFSAKLGRIFKHAAKGLLVVSSPLQSGAENLAKNSRIGIVKYDQDGFEIIADRTGGLCAENRFIKSQIFMDDNSAKPLKFSAYYGGKFFGSIDHLVRYLDPSLAAEDEYTIDRVSASVPFVSNKEIRQSAQVILKKIDYKAGSVDLAQICSKLSIDLEYTNQTFQDGSGSLVLGSANFDRKSIQVNSHDNKRRERFTIAHEIGHFCLNHDQYLRSETILEQDLLINTENEGSFNYESLEFQANAFASELLLPIEVFKVATNVGRKRFDFKNIGFGDIYVDNQPCNYVPYYQLLQELSSYFDVSKQVIEIKLKKLGLLTDKRYM